LFAQWVIVTCAAAAFFTLVPMAIGAKGNHPPIAVAILFPAIVFGIVSVVKFLSGRG
jgi:hypothetical protein